MNAVEIEEEITELADQPFDPDNFPFAFLEAFGNKITTIKKLRKGASNKSDLGGVLQRNHIHIVVCGPGEVPKTLTALHMLFIISPQKTVYPSIECCTVQWIIKSMSIRARR
ncbi:MAG: hypothetical protein L3J58_05755 [Emcibacter sp.]|nr:hypothetical protein [Emcibacter sp.]